MRVILAKHGVPWDVTREWSPGRRLAALYAIAEDNGGKVNWATGAIEWPGARP